MSIWQLRERIFESGAEMKAENRYFGVAGMEDNGRQGSECDYPGGVEGKAAVD